MIWYLVMTLLAEGLHLFLQPPTDAHISLTISRVLVYLFGTASFTVLIRVCFILRGYETKPDA